MAVTRIKHRKATRKTTRKVTRKTTSKAAAKKRIGAMGTRIMAEAKRILKANPRMKWTSCVSKAAKSLRK